MRKPLNRIDFRTQTRIPDEQPMLKRSRNLRYDSGPLSDFDWYDLDSDALDFESAEADMDVTGAGSVGGAGAIRSTQMSPGRETERTSSMGLNAPQDEVQISSAARALGETDAATSLHEARLSAIRAAIEDGTYETPDKLEAAVDRLLAQWKS
ncbi:MAG: flagellar biosynthesis anti-sigma factor FlgM [Planctomycetaceae bacterium]